MLLKTIVDFSKQLKTIDSNVISTYYLAESFQEIANRLYWDIFGPNGPQGVCRSAIPKLPILPELPQYYQDLINKTF